jgi:predicted dehydrogenase
MATRVEDCVRIVEAIERNHLLFAVAHVLRYTPYSRMMKQLVSSGAIGTVVSIQHLEPIGHFHFAHSYVRGNWCKQAESSFSLLAKSCHDIDWIHWIMDRKCVRAQSFGSLLHFRPENKPEGGGSRCLDCAVESQCVYSAKKIYLDRARNGQIGWPVSIIVPGPVTEESVTEALKEGPYGRCVYECDNDVNDNQVVNMQYVDGSTASFTMVAFSKEICIRKTRIFGTAGELEGDGRQTIQHHDFLTGRTNLLHPSIQIPNTGMVGHEYGDYYLMRDFIDAVLLDDPSKILSGPREV